MGKVKIKEVFFYVRENIVSIPNGKGKDIKLNSTIKSMKHVSIPNGKGKVGSEALDTKRVHIEYQFPMGKVKFWNL